MFSFTDLAELAAAKQLAVVWRRRGGRGKKETTEGEVWLKTLQLGQETAHKRRGKTAAATAQRGGKTLQQQ